MRLHLALTATAVCGAALLAGQQTASTVFTAEQAAAGRASYQASCASCHLPDLAGRNEAPQLAGANFMNTWRARSTRDLFEYISSAMPPSGENLGAEQYLAITAFILQANGAAAGSQPFTATTTVPIGSVATGVVSTAGVPADAARGRGAAAAAGQAATATTATPAGRGDRQAPAGPARTRRKR